MDDILYFNGNITQSSVKFYNTIGSLILEIPLQNSMNIENLNKGIYFVQLSFEGSIIHTGKVFVP